MEVLNEEKLNNFIEKANQYQSPLPLLLTKRQIDKGLKEGYVKIVYEGNSINEEEATIKLLAKIGEFNKENWLDLFDLNNPNEYLEDCK